MRSMGFGVHYGYWLVTGKPRIILFDFWSILENINKIKATLWERHKVSTLHAEELVNHVLAFGEMVRIFLTELASERGNKTDVIAHFHEWMASSAIPDLRQDNVKVATVFTTHATMLGRYLAGNVPNFYEKLHEFDWLKEAKHYGIEAQATIERLAAQMAHSMTTVSDVTARECEHLLGKVPDLILPNGLNITRFSAMHLSLIHI